MGVSVKLWEKYTKVIDLDKYILCKLVHEITNTKNTSLYYILNLARSKEQARLLAKCSVLNYHLI